MAKARKTAKKTDEANHATTEAAPPPAEPQKTGEPAGGTLVWEQHGKDTWLAPDPEDDKARAGARIKMNSQGWRGKPDDPLFTVYRDAEYLGSDPTLDAAKRRAQYREKSARALTDKVGGEEGMPAFLELSAEERRRTRDAAPPPARRDTFARPPPQPPGDPALARALAERTALAGEKQKVKAEKAARKKASVFDDDAVITVSVDKNPRKPGTGAHARFALLMEHSGKTVGQFKAAKGNLETLENAVKDGRASISEKE